MKIGNQQHSVKMALVTGNQARIQADKAVRPTARFSTSGEPGHCQGA
jgi:hypothetical protein